MSFLTCFFIFVLSFVLTFLYFPDLQWMCAPYSWETSKPIWWQFIKSDSVKFNINICQVAWESYWDSVHQTFLVAATKSKVIKTMVLVTREEDWIRSDRSDKIKGRHVPSGFRFDSACLLHQWRCIQGYSDRDSRVTREKCATGVDTREFALWTYLQCFQDWVVIACRKRNLSEKSKERNSTLVQTAETKEKAKKALKELEELEKLHPQKHSSKELKGLLNNTLNVKELRDRR